MILYRFRTVLIAISLLVMLDVIVWILVFSSADKELNLELYFLDVGQGDSQLAILPGNIKVLIDGGRPNSEALKELDRILSVNENYIDLVVLTYPDLDHFGGLIDVLKKYEIGVFVSTGRKADSESYGSLRGLIDEKKINYIALMQGDRIKYKNSEFLVLSPNLDHLLSNEINDSSLVLMFSYEGLKTLYTGDIGFNIEEYLVQNYDLRAQILKVGHHGSRFSSGKDFLEEVNPQVSIIGVGKNRYGHPTLEALKRLKDIDSKILRTDQSGTVRASVSGQDINLFADRIAP